MSVKNEVRVVFDSPPGPDAGRFIEVEDATGQSFQAGEWRERDDGFWELVLSGPAVSVTVREVLGVLYEMKTTGASAPDFSALDRGDLVRAAAHLLLELERLGHE